MLINKSTLDEMQPLVLENKLIDFQNDVETFTLSDLFGAQSF